MFQKLNIFHHSKSRTIAFNYIYLSPNPHSMIFRIWPLKEHKPEGIWMRMWNEKLHNSIKKLHKFQPTLWLSKWLVQSLGILSQSNKEIVFLLKPNIGTAATRVRDFTSINPIDFHGYEIKKYP